jgi:hypothetical protein
MDIIRVPDSEDSSYDQFFGVPEGMTAEQAVVSFNAAIEALDSRDEGGDDDGHTGENLETILRNLNMHAVTMHHTVEW